MPPPEGPRADVFETGGAVEWSGKFVGDDGLFVQRCGVPEWDGYGVRQAALELAVKSAEFSRLSTTVDFCKRADAFAAYLGRGDTGEIVFDNSVEHSEGVDQENA